MGPTPTTATISSAPTTSVYTVPTNPTVVVSQTTTTPSTYNSIYVAPAPSPSAPTPATMATQKPMTVNYMNPLTPPATQVTPPPGMVVYTPAGPIQTPVQPGIVPSTVTNRPGPAVTTYNQNAYATGPAGAASKEAKLTFHSNSKFRVARDFFDESIICFVP